MAEERQALSFDATPRSDWWEFVLRRLSDAEAERASAALREERLARE